MIFSLGNFLPNFLLFDSVEKKGGCTCSVSIGGLCDFLGGILGCKRLKVLNRGIYPLRL